jgi:hypothetical protein
VVVVLVLVDTLEAGGTLLEEEDSVLLDQDSVVVPGTTIIAEACVSLIRAPGSFILRLVDRPRCPYQIAG